MQTFEKAYEAEDRHAVQDERWSVFTREQIAEKGNSLDLGLIRDDSVLDYNDLPDPADSAEEAARQPGGGRRSADERGKGIAGAGGAGTDGKRGRKKKPLFLPQSAYRRRWCRRVSSPYQVPENWVLG